MRALPGHPDLTLTLRRSARARRFSLRVSRLDGRVTLSLPVRARESEALAFAAGQADWIRRTLARASVSEQVGFGMSLPFGGQLLRLEPARVRAPVIAGAILCLPPDPERAAARTLAFLKLQARQRLQVASDHYAAMLGRPHAGLTLRDTRSRWGSCASDGRLMYSWRLIMAPPLVLDYVAAHEVAHLAEMNHSPAFWAVVRRLMPDYETHRRWLKTEGNALHRFRFGAADS
ncbi:MAG: SprT family zinc-dependent metalloprotease [Rhodobacteraceae bacterium]|nr:SprT family zinc-dependent metalloprotease [Paracoccaceae bacterium]